MCGLATHHLHPVRAKHSKNGNALPPLPQPSKRKTHPTRRARVPDPPTSPIHIHNRIPSHPIAKTVGAQAGGNLQNLSQVTSLRLLRPFLKEKQQEQKKNTQHILTKLNKKFPQYHET